MRLSVWISLSLSLALPGAASAADPWVSVDFSRPQYVSNAMGFTHGGVLRLSPPLQQKFRARASLLRPGIWRGVPQLWSLDPHTVRAARAQPVIQLGDIWGLPGNWPPVWPYQNLISYSTWVTQRAKNIKAWFPTGTVWVDVWNEPDTPRFWPTAKDPNLTGYMHAFLTAEQALRRELGTRVRVIGPSTASRASAWTGRLVSFCAAHGCRLDGIAWHVNGGGPTAMAGLGHAMGRIRRMVSTDPHWRHVVRTPTTFLVTEYLPAGKRHSPGAVMSYWAQMEHGTSSRGALAVWTSGDARDGILDSLLDDAGRPRSTWWASRFYAIGRTERVRSVSSNALSPGLATHRGSLGGWEVLLGSWGAPGRWVELRLHRLPSRPLRLRIAVMREVRSPWKGSEKHPYWRDARPIRAVHWAAVRRVYVPAGSVVAVAIG